MFTDFPGVPQGQNMDVLKYKGFYKSNSMKRGDAIKAASSQYAQKQREISRNEIRQTYRNMNDSEDENTAPEEPNRSKRCPIELSSILSAERQYHCRLNRLREFRERKRMMVEQKATQRAPFIPFVSRNRVIDEKPALKVVNGDRKKNTPLREHQWIPMQQTTETKCKTPLAGVRFVKPRVDCWLQRDTAKQISAERPSQPKVALKLIAKARETQQPIIKISKSVERRVMIQRQKPKQQMTKLQAGSNALAALVTSTARKHRHPLAFTFDAACGAVVNKSSKLTVGDAGELFDGISPIEVEPSPSTTVRKRSTDVAPVIPSKNSNQADSIWEPQPVASIVEVTVLGNETGVISVNNSPIYGQGKLMAKEKNECLQADWAPSKIHSIAMDTSQIHSSNSVVAKTSLTRKPALNESFTINHEDDDDAVGWNVMDSIFGCRPTIMSEEPDGSDSTGEGVQKIEQDTSSSQKVLPYKTFPSRRQSSVWSVTDGTEEPDNTKLSKECVSDLNPPNSSALLRKRSSVIFIEETTRSIISPSGSSSNQAEINVDADDNPTSIEKSARKRRSSSFSVGSVFRDDDGEQEQVAPEEVLEKTRFYYEKVNSELSRLEALCNVYAPFLEGEEHLNDHCKGLILAAQGQTNILINKKLTKFRELVGHYEKKWNDRKVRKDDLDGFWLMVSLDLENLDQRFEELRILRENNWQEIEQDLPPKVKKLQGGKIVKKRGKQTSAAKKPSSSIANLIRKARQEQLKQKANQIDLGTLAETVTLITTPIKRLVRFNDTPKRISLHKRSSLRISCTPTTTYWEQGSSPAPNKRRTIFPEITQQKESVKSILKTPRIVDKRRAKSVLFLDSGLETPPTRRRQSSRNVMDTPKPKIKFNEELGIEHIDEKIAQTPPRLAEELHKRRRMSLLVFSASKVNETAVENGDEVTTYPRTPHINSSSGRRINRRSSRNLGVAFVNTENDDLSGTTEQKVGSAKRITRSSATRSRKRNVGFS